jgi:hypothetical protein
VSLNPLRKRVESFLTALEEERYQLDLAQRRRPQLGTLYAAAADLFSLPRIAEVQRVLAGEGGAEERRTRALLEFLCRGRAACVASAELDARIGWEIFGSVEVEESRIPHRQIPAALGLAGDPERRRAIEIAHLETLEEQSFLAEDYQSRHRDAVAELGYGSHVEAYQILGGVDLETLAREGERFLEETRDLYLDLLGWHLPSLAGVRLGKAWSGDGARLEAAPAYDALLAGGERGRHFLGALGEAGLDPSAEGRLHIEWEAYLGSAGAVCRPKRVPADVLLAVSTRSGRPAVASFLHACGVALHHAYTDAELPVEQRCLGDDSVPEASGALFASLLRSPNFLARIYDFAAGRAQDYRRLEVLCTLLAVRRDVARLSYSLAMYCGDVGAGAYADTLTEATGLGHDARAAAWDTDVEFAPARRLRAVQLAALYATGLRNRYDEDWFRNPRAGEYLRDLFSHGRRYTAAELAVQLGSTRLGFTALTAELLP